MRRHSEGSERQGSSPAVMPVETISSDPRCWSPQEARVNVLSSPERRGKKLVIKELDRRPEERGTSVQQERWEVC